MFSRVFQDSRSASKHKTHHQRGTHEYQNVYRNPYGTNSTAVPSEKKLEILKAKRDKNAEKDRELAEEIEKLEARVPLENDVKEKLERAKAKLKEAENDMKEAMAEAKKLNVDPGWRDEKVEGWKAGDPSFEAQSMDWNHRHRHRQRKRRGLVFIR